MSDLYGMGTNLNTNGNNNGFGSDDKKKKLMIIIGIAVVGVIVIMMIIIGIISAANKQKNNMYIDGSGTKIDASIMQIGSDNVPYICVEKLAPKLSYQFFNGEYGTGNEDKTHCYVRNENEIALLEMDTDVVYKTLVKDDTSTFDYYKMSYKVKRINDKLYISLPTMQKVFNVKYTYDSEKNVLRINTLQSLYNKYNASLKAAGYYEISSEFSNQKALIENMVVVITKDRMHGVLNIQDNSVIIGTKYSNMIYSEGTNEFFVQNNNKCGILVKNTQGEATVKVEFAYDSLKLIDNNIGLYLAQDNRKYGVLDKTGKIIINLEYDKIGIENPKLFPMDNIKNSYVLYDNCIPVKQGDKWYMFNTDGVNILPRGSYGFGCVVSTSQTSQNVLLIPGTEGTEGIVSSVKTTANKVKYGIIDTQNAIYRVAPSFDSIYRTISGGETEYYMLFGNTIMKVSDRLTESSTDPSGSNSSTVQIN